ncbi:hypothetical protein JOE09_003729 [Pantoea coffeiphila]|nr:hypothetical protein [Pantoea coffeiphila]
MCSRWLAVAPAGRSSRRFAVPSLRSSACRTDADARPARLRLSPTSLWANPGFLATFSAADCPSGAKASPLSITMLPVQKHRSYTFQALAVNRHNSHTVQARLAKHHDYHAVSGMPHQTPLFPCSFRHAPPYIMISMQLQAASTLHKGVQPLRQPGNPQRRGAGGGTGETSTNTYFITV